jgi:hypothetical protein
MARSLNRPLGYLLIDCSLLFDWISSKLAEGLIDIYTYLWKAVNLCMHIGPCSI